MTLDDLATALFTQGGATQGTSSGLGSSGGLLGMLGLGGNTSGSGGLGMPNMKAASGLLSAGAPQQLPAAQTMMPPQGGGQRGPFPYAAPQMPQQPVPMAPIPNLAALLKQYLGQ